MNKAEQSYAPLLSFFLITYYSILRVPSATLPFLLVLLSGCIIRYDSTNDVIDLIRSSFCNYLLFSALITQME